MSQDLDFASFDSDFEEASYSLVGIPYDKTSSFRAGTKKAPDRIREASYCFEPYLHEHSVQLHELKLHDAGDIVDWQNFGLIEEELRDFLSKVTEQRKFPIIFGGEHSISPVSVGALKKEFPDLNVLTLDAHLDFRDVYEGMKHSHATANRRISEIVGIDGLAIVGVRSISRSFSDSESPYYLTSKEIKNDDRWADKILENIDAPIYLSIDMDVLDPSYAPGVGNPEPFGISSFRVKEIIDTVSDRLVGMDLVEVNPKYDEGNMTSNLAARLIYEMIGAREKE